MDRRTFIKGIAAAAALSASPVGLDAAAQAKLGTSGASFNSNDAIKKAYIEGTRKIALHYNGGKHYPEYACLFKIEHCRQISGTVFYG